MARSEAGLHHLARLAAAVAALAQDHGAPDILFNVAGIVHHGSILDCEEAEWDAAFEVNVKAAYRIIRAFLPAMLAAGGGSIVRYDGLRYRVGPESAGADPGPACYRRGGPLTITDPDALGSMIGRSPFRIWGGC